MKKITWNALAWEGVERFSIQRMLLITKPDLP